MKPGGSTLRICLMLGAGFLLLGLSGCWSARCPKVNCKVQVEHRHGDQFYRPRTPLSWTWSRSYRHVRANTNVGRGPNQMEKKKIWNRIWMKVQPNSAKKNQ